MTAPDKSPTAERRLAARELLERFPVLPTDRAWRPELLVLQGFYAADRVFDKHLKGKTKAKIKGKEPK